MEQMPDQKKLMLTLFGVILIMAGLILGTYAVKLYHSAQQGTAYISGGLAVISVIIGGVLLKIRRKHIVVE